jgi:hypothetical protein
MPSFMTMKAVTVMNQMMVTMVLQGVQLLEVSRV